LKQSNQAEKAPISLILVKQNVGLYGDITKLIPTVIAAETGKEIAIA
jgi:hypothetical protein